MQVQLPDGTLAEFPDDMAQADIEAVLQKQFGEPVGLAEDVGLGLASGVARSVPHGLDFGAQVLAKGCDWAAGGDTPFSDFTATPFNDMASFVLGDEYEPRTSAGSVAKFGGEVIGPVGWAKAAKGGAGFLRGLRNGVEIPKTAEELEAAYKAGREQLKDVNLAPDEVRAGLVEPLEESLQYENAARYGNDVGSMLDELRGFGRKGVNANYLESFRQDLGVLPTKFAAPIRKGIDEFYEGASIPSDFRSAYAVKARGERLNDALTVAGESITKRRNAINKFAATQGGLSKAEKEGLKRGGKSSVMENLLRGTASVTGPVGAGGAAIASGNPLLVLGGFLGKGLKAGADKIADRRIEAARQLVEQGGLYMPGSAERLGGMLRELLSKRK